MSLPARPAPVVSAALALLLLVLINLFNYIDRQVLSAVLPKLALDATLFQPNDPNLQMKLGWVHRPYFQKKFGVDVGQRFAGQIGNLTEHGFAASDAEGVRLNRQGLLQVDKLLHEFFLPQHRAARYA